MSMEARRTNQADEIVRFLYDFLAKRMEPQALNLFIARGLKARGSQSVHGFMRMLSEHHWESRQRKQGG